MNRLARRIYIHLCNLLFYFLSVKPTGIALSPNVLVHRVNEGSKVDITCSVSHSNPSAQFKWTKYGSVAFSKTNVMLSFATVNRTDAGNYTCNASNAHGHVAKQIELVVLCKYYFMYDFTVLFLVMYTYSIN